MRTITIPKTTYERLESMVRGFNDTPAQVIERLLSNQTNATYKEKIRRKQMTIHNIILMVLLMKKEG